MLYPSEHCMSVFLRLRVFEVGKTFRDTFSVSIIGFFFRGFPNCLNFLINNCFAKAPCGEKRGNQMDSPRYSLFMASAFWQSVDELSIFELFLISFTPCGESAIMPFPGYPQVQPFHWKVDLSVCIFLFAYLNEDQPRKFNEKKRSIFHPEILRFFPLCVHFFSRLYPLFFQNVSTFYPLFIHFLSTFYPLFSKPLGYLDFRRKSKNKGLQSSDKTEHSSDKIKV